MVIKIDGVPIARKRFRGFCLEHHLTVLLTHTSQYLGKLRGIRYSCDASGTLKTRTPAFRVPLPEESKNYAVNVVRATPYLIP